MFDLARNISAEKIYPPYSLMALSHTEDLLEIGAKA